MSQQGKTCVGACAAIANLTASDSHAEPDPELWLRKHLAVCGHCWKAWAEMMIARQPPVRSFPWPEVALMWERGAGAAELTQLMDTLPPFLQAAGNENETVNVRGVELQVSPTRIGRIEGGIENVVLDVQGSDEQLRHHMLALTLPKGAVGKSHVVTVAPFRVLRKGGFKATVRLPRHANCADPVNPQRKGKPILDLYDLRLLRDPFSSRVRP